MLWPISLSLYCFQFDGIRLSLQSRHLMIYGDLRREQRCQEATLRIASWSHYQTQQHLCAPTDSICAYEIFDSQSQITCIVNKSIDLHRWFTNTLTATLYVEIIIYIYIYTCFSPSTKTQIYLNMLQTYNIWTYKWIIVSVIQNQWFVWIMYLHFLTLYVNQ